MVSVREATFVLHKPVFPATPPVAGEAWRDSSDHGDIKQV